MDDVQLGWSCQYVFFIILREPIVTAFTSWTPIRVHCGPVHLVYRRAVDIPPRLLCVLQYQSPDQRLLWAVVRSIPLRECIAIVGFSSEMLTQVRYGLALPTVLAVLSRLRCCRCGPYCLLLARNTYVNH